jgi:Lethal giant larvae(Lgl) like, C-terminal
MLRSIAAVSALYVEQVKSTLTHSLILAIYVCYVSQTTIPQQQQQQCVLIAVHADGEVRVWGMPTSNTLVYTPLHTSTNGASTLVSNGCSSGGVAHSSSGSVCVGSVMASSQQQFQQQPLQKTAAR